jgi:cupin fold WbuC family metalloprotein
MKQYFKNFNSIEQVQNAKSLSFFTKEDCGVLTQDIFNEFENILQNNEENFRLSLHNSITQQLHNMIIGMKKNKYVYPHKHAKEESYHIIKGKVLLIYFQDNSDIKKSVILEHSKSLVARVDKNTYHALIALQDSIFHEVRLGPFISNGDSIFPNWHKENPSLYMKNLQKSIIAKDI